MCIYVPEIIKVKRSLKKKKKNQLFQEEKGHFTLQMLHTLVRAILQELPIDTAGKEETNASPVLCSGQRKQ